MKLFNAILKWSIELLVFKLLTGKAKNSKIGMKMISPEAFFLEVVLKITTNNLKTKAQIEIHPVYYNME